MPPPSPISAWTCWAKVLTSLEIILTAELEEDAEKNDGQSSQLPVSQLLSQQPAHTHIDQDLASVDYRTDEGEGRGGQAVVVEDTAGLVSQEAAKVGGAPHQTEEIRGETGVAVLDWRGEIFHQGISGAPEQGRDQHQHN